MPPDRQLRRRQKTCPPQRLDRSIPRSTSHETRQLRDMAVNMNLTPFLMLPVLPIILIHSSPTPELATAVTLALLAASRRSRLTYRHIRTT